jgi:hypothetical protein
LAISLFARDSRCAVTSAAFAASMGFLYFSA